MPILANSETCTACMACLNACAKGAISFVQDNESFLQPQVDADRCVECHLCEKVCPEIQQEFYQHDAAGDVYAGWNKTDRQVSSSGGAFSSIARYVLAKGGVVYGSTLDENLECKHIEVTDIAGLDKLRGSKYMQSATGTTFMAVKKHLIAGKYVLFSGTPCQVSGLYSYLKKEYPKLITMDLICHGVPSNEIFSQYVKKLKNRLGQAENLRITNYEFRRRDGWGFSPSISTTISNCRKIYGIDALYMSAFDRAATFRRACYQCHYATANRVGDFSIGDFWGLGHQGVPFKYDMTKGVSFLLVNSDKGRVIMTELGEDDFYVKRTLEEAAARNHNLTKVSVRPTNREQVIAAFLDENMSLDEIEKKYQLIDRSLKNRLSELASRFGIYDLLKKIHNAIG